MSERVIWNCWSWCSAWIAPQLGTVARARLIQAEHDDINTWASTGIALCQNKNLSKNKYLIV